MQLKEINQKYWKTKKISRQDKTIQIKQYIPKQRKKIQPANRERMH